MVQRKTQKRNSADTTKILIALIGVLAVLLVVAICVAVSLRPGETEQPSETTSQECSSGDTQSPIGLTLDAPVQQEFITVEEKLTFTGASDPKESLSVNGQEVSRNADGTFSHEVTLTSGMNEIVFSHKGESVRYAVEYRYAVEKFAPEGDKEYNSGAAIQLSVSAREGSEVKAEFGGKTIPMEKADNQLGSGTAEGFVLYTGTYRLPSTNTSDQDMGKIVYTVTCNGVTETYSSGNIVCKKSADVLSSDPSVTPDYGDYIDVGSGYIVEIVTYSAETFNGKTRDDYSDPRNNYLPQGTMDYGKTDVVYDTSGKIEYRLLRCGYRVYETKENYPVSGARPTAEVPVVDCYRGTLPDHNEVGFASMTSDGAYTVLTLDSLWKAPFYFDVAPQTYSNPDNRDFSVVRSTAEYIDITFCYATSFEGEVPITSDNPLFSSAVVTKNESDCTLRLYLKEKGAFYGWDSYYNDNDQLCFRFLNPARVTATANNAYGADLTGVRILIDVGHGGIDGGSPATDASGNTVDEAQCNLNLAFKLRDELQSMGATVILNRTDDSSLTVDERIQHIKEQAPDYCIAIHQNAYKPLPSVNGCEVMYFGPNSALAAKEIYEEILDSGVYNKTKLKWYMYYMCRETVCPVVLVECGYMTNPDDLAGMLDPDVLRQKAEDMAQGIANYFLKINQ